MLSVDKYTNVLDDKKEAVVTTPFPEKKLLTTEKVTTHQEDHKRTDNIKTNEEVVKGTDEVQKHTDKIKTNEEVEKGIGKTEYTKEALFKIRWNNSDKFEGQSKGSTGWFNLDHEFLKVNVSILEPDFYKNFMKSILKVYKWNSTKRF